MVRTSWKSMDATRKEAREERTKKTHPTIKQEKKQSTERQNEEP
jgi:hypothetical protein